ncbi:MAG: histidine phosphatase family protein [Acidimicrobiia bacterium]
MSEPRELRQGRFTRPPGATELLLVRHGESAAFHEGAEFPLVDGHGDPPLHPEGRRQAGLLADRLQHDDITAIYVSPLQRTHQTAAPLAERLGVTPIVEPDLCEVHLGEWEGGAVRKHMAEGHPVAQQLHAEQRWDVIPGAEPAELFRERAKRAITTIAARHRDECVVVVSHGAIMGQILALATGSQPFAFNGSDNASISQLVVVGERWMVRRFNDTAHLGTGLTVRAQPLT